MPSIIDPETMNVDDLPGIWSPVQWELTEEERLHELNEQTTASLLWAVDVPEAILRLLLSETAIERAFEPPPGYDPDEQGEWDDSITTYQFRRPIKIERVERERDNLYIEYNFGDLGHWAIEIEPECVHIERI
ncbi:MAG: hypothetical protein EHM70_05325 [Chloroflexota bacterium]|nr:MAG: hypothetical protein EHM70_05325 [Chloroflexota bacterium]